MNRKTIKILTAVVTFAMIMAFSLSAFALSPDELTGNTQATGTQEIENLGNNIIGVLQTVGIVVSVVVIIVLGIKYMMGSASEKAEYKKTMIPYLVGAILIFAASALANVVYQFAIGI